MKKYILIFAAIICFLFGSIKSNAALPIPEDLSATYDLYFNFNNSEYLGLRGWVRNCSTTHIAPCVLVSGGTTSLYLISDESFTLECNWNTSDRFPGTWWPQTARQSGNIYYYNLMGGSMSGTVIQAQYPIFYTSEAQMLSKLNNNNLEGVYFPKPEIDEYEYKPDLGYLSGIENKTRLYDIVGDDGLIKNKTLRFSWDGKTTTGIDLWRNSYRSMNIQLKIRCYGKHIDRKGNVTDTFDQLIEKDPFDVSQISYMYTTDDMEADFPSIFQSAITGNSWGTDAQFDFYFRILAEDGSNYYRGGWLRVHPEFSTGIWGKFNNDSVSVDSGDFVDGQYSSNGPGVSGSMGYGSGVSAPAADANVPVIEKTSWGDDVYNSITNIAATVTAVPSMIAAILSFMPSWVLTLIGANFALISMVIVLKFIRG